MYDSCDFLSLLHKNVYMYGNEEYIPFPLQRFIPPMMEINMVSFIKVLKVAFVAAIAMVSGILFEGDIDEIKTNMFKVQISFKEEFNKKTFKDLELLSFKKTGSVASLIIKGDKEEVSNILESMNPVILDYLPLTLEEIFIYEMEVLGYEFDEVI